MDSVPEWARQRRSGWRYVGQERPPFAVIPKPGQQSVWDYPRPPRIERDPRQVIVRVGAVVIAHSHRSARVLETGSPPSFYLPPEDVELGLLKTIADSSSCEWKGEASYYNVVVDGQINKDAAWYYPDPKPAAAEIKDHVAFWRGVKVENQ